MKFKVGDKMVTVKGEPSLERSKVSQGYVWGIEEGR